MRAGVSILCLACAGACAGPASGITTAETEGTSDGDGSIGTSSHGDDGEPTTGGEADLGGNETLCPPSSEVSLCLPATSTDGQICLCSRQAFGPALVTVGDLDGDGVEDLLVRLSQTIPYTYDAAQDALVAMPEIDWPFDVAYPYLSYVPTLGVAAYAAVIEPGMQVLGTYDFSSGVGEPVSITFDPEAHRTWAIGDFDGDGQLDFVEAVRDPVDFETSLLTVTVHYDVLHDTHSVELSSEEIENAIDTPSLSLHVSDFDGDGHDDLLVYALGQDFPRVLWGDALEDWRGSGTPVNTSYLMRVADLDQDGRQEIISYSSWSFGSYGVVQHPSARTFEDGPITSPPAVGIDANDLVPVMLGDRVAILALATDSVLAPVRDGAMGWTTLATPSDVSAMRVTLLEEVTVQISGVIDVDGDGRQEVLARYGEGAEDSVVYLFDIVEG
mgnify:CR=1 FL=1